MAELKPCPFCYGSVSVVKVDNTWWKVCCDDCPAEVGRYWFAKRSEAIEAWNRRAGESDG